MVFSKNMILVASVRFVATLLLNVLMFCGVSLGQFPPRPLSHYQKATGCPPLRYSVDLDSVAQKASLDSAITMSTGQWQLTEIRSNSIKKPTDIVIMCVTREGKGEIYQNNKLRSVFEWTFRRDLDRIQFTIQEQGDLLFPSFRNRKSWLFICAEKMELMSGRSDGVVFTFERSFAGSLPKK